MKTLEYDFDKEAKFSYQGISESAFVTHFSDFIAKIWQAHPFREGNTRTTAVKIWGPTAERLSSREIFDLLSVTGGVPKYVEEVRAARTSDENIRRLCFLQNGLLYRDFDETFNSVFGAKFKSRGRLLRILASGPKTAAELAAAEGRESNGAYSEALKDLMLAGFIANDAGINPQTCKPMREARYRVKDNYIRFYLHFIEPRKKAIAGSSL